MARSSRWAAPVLAAMAAAWAQQPASVSGTVINSVTGAPILRAHVTFRNGERKFGAMTNGGGKFSITGLAPGSYSVNAERVGFMSAEVELELSTGDRKDSVDMKLVPFGAITGRVLDADGDPVQLATVTARGLSEEGRAVTDGKGQYRIGGLPPGKYRVLAAVQARPYGLEIHTDGSKDVRYSPTYYAGAQTSKEATRVAVPPGGELSGIDVRLVSTPVVKVSGKVLDMPEGMRELVLSVMHETGPESSESVEMRAIKPDGAFAVWGLTPGKYTFSVVPTNGRAGPVAAPADVEVGTSNVEHVDLRLVQPFDLQGQLRFESDEARQKFKKEEDPNMGSDRQLVLQPTSMGSTLQAELGADDSFKLEKVQPGRYRVEFQGGGGAYVKSVRLGSAEVEGNLLDVRNGADGALTLTVSGETCEISGTVSDAKGPVAGVSVMLMPDYGSGDVSEGTQTNSSGHYSIKGLQPGKYILLAGDENIDRMMNLRSLEDYEDAMAKVEVRAGDKVTQDLKKLVKQ